jgi:hypothetical protein
MAVRTVYRAPTAPKSIRLQHSDHLFDMVAAKWSPAARVAFYALERFLAAVRPVMPRLNEQEAEGATTAIAAPRVLA